MTPKISIITIVRNGMPFVSGTIESVIGQHYDRLEYIVIDGGSTDGTLDVIRSQGDRISKWISEPDRGIADAFNKGLALATGDYIQFLNADDALAGPDAVSGMAEKMIESGFPELIYGDCDVLDRDSGKILYRASIGFSPEGLKQGKILPHPSLFAHRSYFERFGEFDTGFRIAMDYEWMLRGAAKVRVVHAPILVTNVRNGGISTVNQARVVNEIIAALKKNHCFGSVLDEWKLRGYFKARAWARKFLEGIGLYRVFFNLRNRPQRRDIA